MRQLPIQEAYQRKFKRQAAIKELEYHASGHCVHIGKLSPGCASCFVPDPFRHNIILEHECNLSCSYCVYGKRRADTIGASDKDRLRNSLAALLQQAARPDFAPRAISFSGGGEPLLHMDTIRQFMKALRAIEQRTQRRPWYYLYTNGLMADEAMLAELRDLGFDEIRFHLGASNFSKRVYRNLRAAVRYIQVVAVETPAWPPHREKLFEMLPIIEEIGVKHLNLGEVEVTPENYAMIERLVPGAEIYAGHEMHLHDGGLAYDIIEEVIRRKYSYSVLDCNCFVKNIQRGHAKDVAHDDISGLIAEYVPGGSPPARPHG